MEKPQPEARVGEVMGKSVQQIFIEPLAAQIDISLASMMYQVLWKNPKERKQQLLSNSAEHRAVSQWKELWNQGSGSPLRP